MNDVEVRPATRSDLGALARTLGRAFYDDPVMTWMLPDDDARRRKLHKLFASLTRYHHLARGGVEVAPDGDGIGGAALWDPPGQWQHARASPSCGRFRGCSWRSEVRCRGVSSSRR